jgi:quercetin dioxygenase-like cupin family protein
MPVITAAEGTEHRLHGAVFTAYANSGTGSAQVCAWSTRLPAGQAGVEHRISGEEVFLVLEGTLRASVDGGEAALRTGDVLIAPAGSLLRLDNPGDGDALIWAASGIGLSARLPDGSEVSPPWAN